MVVENYYVQEVKQRESTFRLKFLRISQSEFLSINDPFWHTLYDEDEITLKCLFKDINSEDIRQTILKNLINFQTFIRFTCMEFVSTAHQIRLKNENFTNCISKVLKIVRALTRFFPFFIECDNSEKLERSIFWNRKRSHLLKNEQQEISSSKATVGSEILMNSSDVRDSDSASIKVGIDEPCIVKEAQSTEGEVNGFDEFEPFELPLGAQIISDCVNLLFTRDFTSPPLEKKLPDFYDCLNVRGEEYCFWEPGIGMNGHFARNRLVIDLHRLEIIRLILVLCSREITLNVNDVLAKGSRFLTVLTACTPGFMIETLVYSLLNLTCRECKLHSSSNINDKHFLYSSEMDSKKEQIKIRNLYVTYAFQLLSLILVYPVPPGDIDFLRDLDITGTNTNIRNATNTKIKNLVRVCSSKIFRKPEIVFIISSYVRYLQRFVKDDCKKEEPFCFPTWTTEIIIIMWELCQVNGRFMKYLTTELDSNTEETWSNELTILLLYFIICYFNLASGKKSANNNENCKVEFSKFVNCFDTSLINIIICYLFYLTSNQYFEKSIISEIKFNILSGDISDIFMIEQYKKHELFFSYRDMILYNLCHLLNSEISSVEESMVYMIVKIMYNLIALSGNPEEIPITYFTSVLIVQLVEKLYNKVMVDPESIFLDCLNLLIKIICQAILFSGKNENCQNTVMLIIALMNKQFLFKQIKSMGNNEEKLNFDNIVISGSLKRNFSFISISDDENSIKEENDRISAISQYSTEKSNKVDFLQTTLPPGMSNKAKGKLPMNQSHLKTWNGFLQNDIILSIIEQLKKKEIKFRFILEENCSSIVRKQEVLKVQRFINQIEKHISKTLQVLNYSSKHKSNRFISKPLKFIWSRSSLGWYKGIIWNCIFIAKNNILLNDKTINNSGKYTDGNLNFVPKHFISSNSIQNPINEGLHSILGEKSISEKETFLHIFKILFSTEIFEDAVNPLLLHSIIDNFNITNANRRKIQ